MEKNYYFHGNKNNNFHRNLKLQIISIEINKRISLHRTPTTEYGFRIHGSRPVVVSAVELASPAELAGLEVGDVIMSINGLQVLDSSHSDVVRIASGAESLELELARTKNVVMETEDLEEQHQDDELNQQIVLRGELGKFNGMDLNSDEGRGARGVWVERYCRWEFFSLPWKFFFSLPWKS